MKLEFWFKFLVYSVGKFAQFTNIKYNLAKRQKYHKWLSTQRLKTPATDPDSRCGPLLPSLSKHFNESSRNRPEKTLTAVAVDTHTHTHTPFSPSSAAMTYFC